MQSVVSSTQSLTLPLKSFPAYPRASFPLQVALLSILIVCSSMLPIITQAAEPQVGMQRIALQTGLYNPDDQTRIMLYSNEFSLLPVSRLNGIYLGNQAPPGVSAGSATLGLMLASLFINHVNSQDAADAVAFKNTVEHYLQDIDIKNEIQNSLSAALTMTQQFKHLEFEHVKRVFELAQPGLLIKIEEKQIMTLTISVSFDHDLKAILIHAQGKLWLKNSSVPIYASEFSYLSSPIQASTLEQLRILWTANQGEQLKVKIREGIHELMWMVAQDMQPAQNELHEFMENIQLTDPVTGKKNKANFYQTLSKPERLIGRSGSIQSAVMVSIPK